jgi:hypothetical protein
MIQSSIGRRAVLAGLLLSLAGCSQFRTYYETPVAAAESADWHLIDVHVNVPETLSVSEAKRILPVADIVWREDPDGDRKAQVAKILADATRVGAGGLKGPRGVTIVLVVKRFHAVSFEAERKLSHAGVHNIDFSAVVIDAKTGAALFGPEAIDASLPAMSGDEMVRARLRGESQKSQISAHVAQAIAGWLGIGPDVRGTFRRLGG